jgi:uncharacterized protein YdbL (DUF1318 family)
MNNPRIKNKQQRWLYMHNVSKIRRATMRKYSVFYAIIALFTLLIFSAEGNCFAGANDIKARMKHRKPTIDKLKSESLVGENNKGFLAFVPGAAPKEENTVSAENKDRRAVYSAIAKKQGTTPQHVGERRAVQIGQRASPGSWLQDPSGKWYKK